MRRIVTTLALALVVALPARAAELVTNGGFETGTIDGWITSTATHAGGLEAAHSGDHGAVFILGDGNLQQQIRTQPGDSYTMSLWLKVPDLNPDRLNEISFSLHSVNSGIGVAYQQFGFAPFDYQQFTLPDYVATDRLAVLDIVVYSGAYHDNFIHRTGSPVDWYVDDVSVTGTPYSSTPEPATWALLLTGFGLAGTALRRQRVIRQRPTT